MPLYGARSYQMSRFYKGGEGWIAHGSRTNLGNGIGNAELIALDAVQVFTQRNLSSDILEAVSSGAGDTSQTLTIYGINSDGLKAAQSVALNGVGAIEFGASGAWLYIEGAFLDLKCAGDVTIRAQTGPLNICAISAGLLYCDTAQHFTGEYGSYITSFESHLVTTDGDALVQLRWHPDHRGCLTATFDGYIMYDEMSLFVTEGPHGGARDWQHSPIYAPPGGWLAVYGYGLGVVTADVAATIKGFDVQG